MENNKLKVSFFVKQGLDSFIDSVISSLSHNYDTNKIIVTHYNQIDEGMQQADICWFEWCDELIIYASKLEAAKQKLIVCRLHSYEAFTDYISQVNWDNVDSLICVNKYIKENILQKAAISQEKITIIANGIDTDKYVYSEKKKGFNIAYVGYINYKKGPMLLLHTFNEIYRKDNNYKLYIAGAFQDERYILYFNHMIKELQLENSIIFQGWQKDLNTWLEDKNYILCTSLLESQNISVMQAMCKGIKPIIHNFVGAKEIYPQSYLWNTMDAAVNLIADNKYESSQYRDFILNNFSTKLQKEKILALFSHLQKISVGASISNKPLVTVGLINYNYAAFLDEAIKSVINQDYRNLEILIIDDFSKDGSIEKIKQYEESNKNIKAIFHTENSGSAVMAFKEIISHASGEYLIMLSSDDYFHDNTVISRFINEFSQDKSLDYIYGDIEVVSSSGTPKNLWQYRQYTNQEIVFNTFRNMGSGVIPLTVGMFKKDFFLRNNLSFYDDPNNRVAGDTLNTLIYLKHGWKRKYLDFTVTCYRQHSDNMTYDIKSRIKSIISVMEYIVENFDIELFFPEIEWTKYENVLRAGLSSLIIGKYYLSTLEAYYGGNIKAFDTDIVLDKEQLKEYVQPLIPVIEKYLEKTSKTTQAFNHEVDEIKTKLTPVKIHYPSLNIASKKSEIYFEGQKLRQNLLNQYKDKYSSRQLKALLYAPPNGAWKYGFITWKHLMNYMGIDADIVFDIDEAVNSIDYNMLFYCADSSFMEKIISNKTISAIPHKVGLISKETFFDSSDYTQRDLQNISLVKQLNSDFLISSFSEKSIHITFKKWLDSGISIRCVPFGFNPIIYYPEEAIELYDYFFVGTNSPLKIEETQKYLLPIVSKFNGILRGANWGETTSELQPHNSRFFYNRSRINLNYHLEAQKHTENEINERTFIISACGGFQLVDNPKLISSYYSDKELAVANDEKDYYEKFIYYLNKPQERHEMAFKALVKTYDNKCSTFHRLDTVLNL